MRSLRQLAPIGSFGFVLALAGCGSGSTGNTFGDGGHGGPDANQGGGDDGGGGSDATFVNDGGIHLQGQDGSTGTGSDGGTSACTGLQCQIHTCTTGSTTISGTIYDPAGNNPLYNIVAYIPNSKPQPFPSGAACAPCSALYTGDPIATALTDASGKFTISNAPDGTDIPLVIQVGKWRKQITIPKVTACMDNPQPDKSLTLPKNKSEGDIPLIAISTGGSDTLECLLKRIGLDDAEYTPAGGTGSIQMFRGGGGYGGMFNHVPDTTPPAPESYLHLWDSKADMLKYDIVLLSCEGEETRDGVQSGGGETQIPLSAADQQVLEDYTSGGGRVFASHFHYAWFSDTLQDGTANTGPFATKNLATWTPGTNDLGTINANILQTLPGGGTFPKGVALNTWLGNVGALTNGELPIQEAKHNADVSAANTLSTPWIAADNKASSPNATEYFSFDTPLGASADKVCGRVVYSDLHVGAASNDQPNMPIPAECTAATLSPQEDALEFMLFDLSSCVTPNSEMPQPPPPVPPPPP